MTNEKQVIDYDNLAFNPYAISTGDLAIEEEDDNIKSDKSMANHGYLQSEAVVENNPHYEDTLEVAKKAGLTGTGRRRKENIVYEESTIKKKKTKDKIQPTLRASNQLPPRPTEEWQQGSSYKTNRWKRPFAILSLLVLLCLVGAALGVLSYFEKKECSCNTLPERAETSKGTSPKPSSSENITETVQELLQQLKELKTKLGEVEKEQQEQKVEQKTKLNNLSKYNEQLSSRVNNINSTFTIKLNSVKSNVSNLAKDMDEFNNTLRNMKIFSRQLFNTIDDINSTFTIKLRNISKQVGTRGFNGSQGAQGPSGIGNLSSCVVETKTNTQQISRNNPKITKAQVDVEEQPGWKIMAVDCSTSERAGAAQTVLSEQKPGTYVCTCAGASDFGPFKPQNDKIECVIRYWQCPVLT